MGKGRSKGRALVTGASRGIGRAIVEALARKGYETIGTCRDPKKIKREDAVEEVTYLPLDLTSERSIEALIRRVRSVDLLVNNAGESMIGPVEEVGMEAARKLFELDYFGQLRLTQGFLGPMREKRRGTIIFIGSMAAETAVLFGSQYAAAKAALKAVARALRLEVRDFGVNVSLIAPFYIRTTIPQVRQFSDKSPYSRKVRRIKELRDARIGAAPGPRIVAGKILQILDTPRPRFFHPVGKGAEANAFLIRHLPRGLVDHVVNHLFDDTLGDR
jgi:NAD(P)-dependent dehydrogenase (short-subunit alcohol dehydrogenase family)